MWQWALVGARLGGEGRGNVRCGLMTCLPRTRSSRCHATQREREREGASAHTRRESEREKDRERDRGREGEKDRERKRGRERDPAALICHGIRGEGAPDITTVTLRVLPRARRSDPVSTVGVWTRMGARRSGALTVPQALVTRKYLCQRLKKVWYRHRASCVLHWRRSPRHRLVSGTLTITAFTQAQILKSALCSVFVWDMY